MQEIGLIAFIAGMIAGFISLRSLGWMCILGLLFLACGRANGWTLNWTVVNTGSSSVDFNIYLNESVGGTSYPCDAFLGGGTLGAGGTTGGSNTGSDGSGVTRDASCVYTATGGTLSCGCCSSGGDAAGLSSGVHSYTFYVGGPPPPPPPVYYSASGCLTNATPFPKGARVDFSDGDPSLTRSPILPGEAWCWTNGPTTNAFTYTISVDTYDGEGNLLDTTVGGPFNSTTNTIGSPGQTGGGTINGPPGNTPAPVGDGGGSNTNLTGNQFNSGVTNIINTLGDLGQFMAGSIAGSLGGLNGGTMTNLLGSNSPVVTGVSSGFNGLGNSLTNLLGTNSLDSALLKAIANNTEATSNSLGIINTNIASILGQTGTNGLGSNFWYMTSSSGQAGVNSQGLTDSNNFVVASGANVGSLTDATNFPSTVDESALWTLPIYTNVGDATHPRGAWNLNFTITGIFLDIAPWLYAFFVFVINVFSIKYIHYRVQETAMRIWDVPGSGPGKGAFSWLTVGAQLILFTTIMAAFPILIATAATAVGYSGGMNSPFSDAGIAKAGGHASSIYLGWQIFSLMFPSTFAITVMIYLFFFDMVVTGLYLWAARLYRALTN